jgi:hypothetical protein
LIFGLQVSLQGIENGLSGQIINMMKLKFQKNASNMEICIVKVYLSWEIGNSSLIDVAMSPSMEAKPNINIVNNFEFFEKSSKSM